MMTDQREFAKALSLVTRTGEERERVATTPSPTPLPAWNAVATAARAQIDRSFSPSPPSPYNGGLSPPNSEDLSVLDEELLAGGGFADEAITDKLGRLRHLQRMSRKGKRQPNWSETENNILVEQFEKYKETLKPRRSEGVSAREKKDAWESICAAVNSSNAAALKRSAKDVRKKWENIRTWARKVVTEWKHDCSQTASTECPPPDPPELAKRIMMIYEGDDDSHDFDDDSFLDSTHIDETNNNHNSRQTPPIHCALTTREKSKSPDADMNMNIKKEIYVNNAMKRSASPINSESKASHLPPHPGSTLNVPMSRRYQRDGLLDYRLLDAARMEERLQQNYLSSLGHLDGNGSGLHGLAASTSPSPPPHKKPKRHQRQEDESKDIRELQREVLILQKEKLIIEKEKLQMEKEKIRLEKENLVLERHRMMSSPHMLLPMMS